MITWDEKTDYKKLMDEAAARGDYKAAAQYEQQRNAKINALDASGSNKWGATTSNDYYGWIDGNNYAADLQKMMAENADRDLVADTLAKRVEKSSNTIGMEGYAHDDIYDQAIQYLMKEPVTQYGENFSYASAPSYTDKYKNQIDDMLNQILNREDFSYDVSKDPLYAQYAQQYTQQGQRSMKDTLGQLSARTGGLASSYATSAAQQASDYYMGQLANKVPELYQMAYEMYLDDKADQVENLGLLQSMSNTQYDRYRNTMSDWLNDRNFAYGVYRDDVSDQQFADEQSKKYALSQAETLAQYGDFSGYKNLGYTDEQINAMRGGYEQNLVADSTEPEYTLSQAMAILKENPRHEGALAAYEQHTGKSFLEGNEDILQGKTPAYTNLLAQIKYGNASKNDIITAIESAYANGYMTEEEVTALMDYAGL